MATRRRRRRKSPAKKSLSSSSEPFLFLPTPVSILEYYYDACEAHLVKPLPAASIAFRTNSPYLVCRAPNGLELKHVLPLCETLAAFPTESSIELLSFQYCNLGEMCAPALAACLRENRTVKVLELPGNMLTDQAADAIAAIIAGAESIEEIRIDSNQLTATSARILANAILANGAKGAASKGGCRLKAIKLTNNYLYQEGVNTLIQAGEARGIEIDCVQGNFWREETWNAIIHGAAIVASICMLVTMCFRLHDCHASDRSYASALIYMVSLLTMFVCSTLYHSLTCCGNQCAVELFCILDHTAIYVLIAGSYTPYLFGSLYDHHPTVAVLGAVFVWSLALVGISLDLCFDPKNKTIRLLSLVIYVVQGWSVAFIAPWLFPLVSSATLNYLAGGGLAYTSGVYFYVRGCTNQKYHIVWHVYVFVGAVLHFYSIMELLFGTEGLYQNCTTTPFTTI
jgi:hemolysin III